MILRTAVDILHVTSPVKLVMELQVHWKLCCVTLVALKILIKKNYF
jgi:hypothetical protein